MRMNDGIEVYGVVVEIVNAIELLLLISELCSYVDLRLCSDGEIILATVCLCL